MKVRPVPWRPGNPLCIASYAKMTRYGPATHYTHNQIIGAETLAPPTWPRHRT